MADEVWIFFYNANRKHIWSVKGELKDGKITAAIPSANARYFSAKIDGHRLHTVPHYDTLQVEYA